MAMKYDVKTYQKRLNELGYYLGKLDGLYGPKTKAAIKNFQDERGITADGIVGPVTWQSLFPSPKPLKAKLDNPPWINEGLKVRGLHETEDKGELIAWLRSDGSTIGDPGVFPWCGDFVETSIKRGLPTQSFSAELQENPYWARNWGTFGMAVQPQYGAVLVFKRGKGGHVGFYMGETGAYYLVLGGNQSNSISISRIAKKRCIAVRWPDSYPQNNRKVNSSGVNISVTTNEE